MATVTVYPHIKDIRTRRSKNPSSHKLLLRNHDEDYIVDRVPYSTTKIISVMI